MSQITKDNEKKSFSDISFIFSLFWMSIPVIMIFVCVWLGFFHPCKFYLNEINIPVVSMDYYQTRYDVNKSLFIVIGTFSLIFVFFVLRYSHSFFNKKSLSKTPWVYLLLLSIPWAFICCLMSGIFKETFFGRKFLFNGLFSFILFGAAYGNAIILNKNKRKILIVKLFTIIVTLLSVIIILQFYFFPQLSNFFNPDYATIFNQHNHFGYVLCMGIVGTMSIYLFDTSISIKQKYINLINIVIQLIALLVNDTFGAYLAVLLTIPVIYFIYFKRTGSISINSLMPFIFFLIISIISSFGLIVGTAPIHLKLIKFVNDTIAFFTNKKTGNKAGTGRGYLWKETIKRIKMRPIFGYGPAGLIKENAIINAGIADSPHNEFLQRAVTTGIPGLVLYVVALYTLAKSFFKNLKIVETSTIIAFLTSLVYIWSSCFGNPVFNTAPFFYIFLGLASSDINAYKVSVSADEYICFSISLPNKIKNIVLSTIVIFSLSFTLIYSVLFVSSEKQREEADISAMYAAYATAQLLISENDIKSGEIYWFDPSTMTLSNSKENIEQYGQGTSINGKANVNKNEENISLFTYNCTEKYTNKIISVTFINQNDNVVPLIEWKYIYNQVFGG